MKTRLLKKIRKRFYYTYDVYEDCWSISDLRHKGLSDISFLYTSGALDHMASHFMSIRKMRRWVNKVFKLNYKFEL